MKETTLSRPLEILVVEDNLAGIRLLQEVLKGLSVQTHLSIVQDGIEALTFLRWERLYAQAVQPDLILLALNFPGKPGLEVLAESVLSRACGGFRA